MLDLVGKVVVNNEQIKEKLHEWPDSLPEIVRERESSNVLAFVFFVEVLKEKEGEKEGMNGKSWNRRWNGRNGRNWKKIVAEVNKEETPIEVTV